MVFISRLVWPCGCWEVNLSLLSSDLESSPSLICFSLQSVQETKFSMGFGLYVPPA
ncbi:hypothetical protein AALP_AA5G186800 [Arabis alpina]|uniref:Uncharacterized protein n=1 Tax=Arabis alpina TaxID=50452 RepID=A0A087GXY7_ARAAL|nr:hypothetical protein AALP_AA5G186800 [Arabis alpina]